MRIGHVGLRQNLYRIGVVDAEICEHCNDQEKETINHYILHCTAFNNQRKELMDKLKTLNVTNVTLKVLLGGEDRYQHVSNKILMALMNYVKSTNRLGDL